MGRLSDTAIAELEALCPGGVARNVDLSRISQWRIGGPADLVIRPTSTAEVSALMRWFAHRAVRPVVIGRTSNILFDDAGLRAPCIQIGSRMSNIQIKCNELHAEAGAWVPGLARRLMQAGLSGAEHISGIPGTLGGLVCMNGGSQRKGIGTNIVRVESVDPSGMIHTRSGHGCDFKYRQSIFQNNGEIITSAVMRFAHYDRATIRAEMRTILSARRKKFPRKQPNCGSVFVSDPATYLEHGPPGTIIEALGFKGRRIGGALVSARHANFIVNAGGARCADVLNLIYQISRSAALELGAALTAEVRYVAPDGTGYPATDIPKELLDKN